MSLLPNGASGQRGRRCGIFVTMMIIMMMMRELRVAVMAEEICPKPIKRTVRSVTDTTIYANGGGVAAGSTTAMVVDLTTSGEARALLKFKKLLPPDAQLIRATLVLSSTSGRGAKVRGHRLLTAWEEHRASWNDITTGEPWEKDVSFELSGKKKVVSADVTADVEAWHRGLAVNNGWILMTSSKTKGRRFYTSEFLRERRRRPSLRLEYCKNPCSMLKDKVLAAPRNNRGPSCRNFQAAECSAVEHDLEGMCPVSLFSKVTAFGGLNMIFTTVFQWRWDNKGSDGRDDAAFYHPLCPPGFFPMGSVAKGDFDGADGNVAATCFQDADNSDLLVLPRDWKKVWDDRGSNADERGSCWRAKCPSGYVALGNVFVTDHKKPDLDDIACVRQDLTDAGSLREVAVWTDIDTDSRKRFSAWQVESSLSDGRIAVNSFVGTKSYEKPDEDLAINMWLPGKKGELCSTETLNKCDPCEVLKEEILILTDRRDKCRAFEEAGCSTRKLGNEELCPPPFPGVGASAEVNSTTPVCEIAPLDPIDIFFDDVMSMARGTDGKYYVVGEVDGIFKLIVMDIVVRIFTIDNTAQCSLEVVQECFLPGKSIEAVAVADPEDGTPQVYIAGQENSDGSPFISLVTPPDDGETKECDVVANAIEFVLPSNLKNGNFMPFFNGLSNGPLERDVLWSATQTSLYRPDQAKTKLGDFQYFLTPFKLGGGKAKPRGEFLYFAETSLPMEESASGSLSLSDNKLVDFVLLDDFGSSLTIESGFLVEKGAPTVSPTDPNFDELFPDDFGLLSMYDDLPPPEPIPPVQDEGYVPTVGPRTCLYRTYVESLFTKVGVARKDLIECVNESYTAIATGAAELLDGGSSSRALLGELEQKHRQLQHFNRTGPNHCTEDNSGRLIIVKNKNEKGRFAGRHYNYTRNHLYTCQNCTYALAEDVGGVFEVQTSAQEDTTLKKIERLVNEASDTAASFELSRKRLNFDKNSKACSSVIGNMDDFDDALEECKGGNCAIDLPPLWQTRGTTINFCCAAYYNTKYRKGQKNLKKTNTGF